MFDKLNSPNYKSDGISWAKKKGTNKIREDFVKLSLNGIHSITALYAFAIENNVLSTIET